MALTVLEEGIVEAVRVILGEGVQEILGGELVRAVDVGRLVARSDVARGCELIELALRAETWGRPVDGYITGLGFRAVVILRGRASTPRP